LFFLAFYLLVKNSKVSGFGCQVSGNSLIAQSRKSLEARKLEGQEARMLRSFPASQHPGFPAVLLTPEH
jgi:hypothetical protein